MTGSQSVVVASLAVAVAAAVAVAVRSLLVLGFSTVESTHWRSLNHIVPRNCRFTETFYNL